MSKNIKVNTDGTISPIDPSKPSSFTTDPTDNTSELTLANEIKEFWRPLFDKTTHAQEQARQGRYKAIAQLTEEEK